MNVEAEAMIERFVWRRLLPCIVVIFLLGIAAFVWLR